MAGVSEVGRGAVKRRGAWIGGENEGNMWESPKNVERLCACMKL